MSRASALVYLQPRFNAVYMQAQRATTDTPEGYGPAIDAALMMMGATTAELLTYTVPPDKQVAFHAALSYTGWDLVINDLAMQVDQQVDAPLTNIKASQAYKNAKERRDEALGNLNTFGLGPSHVNWIRWNLDFLEPVDGTSNQWG